MGAPPIPKSNSLISRVSFSHSKSTSASPKNRPASNSNASDSTQSRTRSGSSISNIFKRQGRRRTSSVIKKRLFIEVEVLNPYNVFKQEIHKKCHFLEYLCCGAWSCCCCHRYCACLCIWFTTKDITEKVGRKVSKQLNAKGMKNEMNIKEGTLNTFELVVRGRSAATQIMAKKVLEKKIKEKLEKKGVSANVKCERREIEITIDNEQKNTNNNNVSKIGSPLVEDVEKK